MGVLNTPNDSNAQLSSRIQFTILGFQAKERFLFLKLIRIVS